MEEQRARMCTLEKRGLVYLLTLTGDDEHRLNPDRLTAISSALAQVRSDSARHGGRGAALVIAADGRFFSNGLDLAWASASPADRLPLMSSALNRTIADLLSLPMPTIAAVTGHAAAAGGALALSHDYVLMRRDRGFFYMSEVDKGLPISRHVIELMRAKISNPRALRDVLLGGAKVKAAEAMEMGFVDGAHVGARETVEAAVRLGEKLAGRNWDGSVYASIRKAALPDLLFDALDSKRKLGPEVEDAGVTPVTNKTTRSRL